LFDLGQPVSFDGKGLTRALRSCTDGEDRHPGVMAARDGTAVVRLVARYGKPRQEVQRWRARG
jgi:hypothetical protein